ncbi:MAG: hypothetical protein IKT27_04430 [Clostridia bacterium]|nr:hypothetical protein [Clostridia bacterium]
MLYLRQKNNHNEDDSMFDATPYLDECIDTKNPYAEKYLSLVSINEIGQNIEKHHIVPVAYYRYVLGCSTVRLVSSPDMIPENIVSLSKANHILAHYFLARCIKNSNNIFVDSQIYAFVNMFARDKSLLKNNPYYTEMAVFYVENKNVVVRYKQYELCPPILPKGCSFYKDAVTPNIQRTGAWITQIRNHGKEHYTFDHFGNCLSVEIQGLPYIYLTRDLQTGDVISINIGTETAVFNKNGFGKIICTFSYNPFKPTNDYYVTPGTYEFANNVHCMIEFIKHILTEKQVEALLTLANTYFVKQSEVFAISYFDIPIAPKRLLCQAA